MSIGSRNSWNWRWIVLLAWALVVAGGRCPVVAAERKVEYPHINLATTYRVDPAWPQRPKNVSWGEMPGVAIDKAGRIWAYTRAKPPVQVYDAAGKFVRAWGEDVIQIAHGLRLDHDGNVWLSDVGTHVVMQFTPEGRLLRTLGTRGAPGDDRTHLNMPTDMAITPAGEVFVADGYGNNRIVHFDRHGKFVKEWGKLGVGPGDFSVPHAIVRDSKGRLYVADRNNVRVQVFDKNGKFLDQWRNLLVPWGLYVDQNDDIWACGSSPMPWSDEQKYQYLGLPPKDQVVMRFAPSGKLLALWTIPKGEDGTQRPGEVNWLHSIALDADGNIFAADIMGKRIQKFVRQAAGTAAGD